MANTVTKSIFCGLSKTEFKNYIEMKIQSILLTVCALFSFTFIHAQQKEVKVASFNKAIISPHIEVTFVEGDQELVVIEDTNVPFDKINIDVNGQTLKVYLEGAKTYTKSKKVRYNDSKEWQDLYYGTQVTMTVIYRNLERLEIRGEEYAQMASPLRQSDFELALYGESDVVIESAELERLNVVMYGESTLKIEEGSVAFQKYKAFGESEVDALGLDNKSAKITAFGESEFRINVSDRLKVTSYGESEVHYTGNPSVDKGVVLGENRIKKI